MGYKTSKHSIKHENILRKSRPSASKLRKKKGMSPMEKKKYINVFNRERKRIFGH